MKKGSRGLRKRGSIALLGCGATLFQGLGLGGCNLTDITTTTTTTVDGRQVLADLILGIVLTPIQAFITNGVNNIVGLDGE